MSIMTGQNLSRKVEGRKNTGLGLQSCGAGKTSFNPRSNQGDQGGEALTHE
jgi:hypothetical protein